MAFHKGDKILIRGEVLLHAESHIYLVDIGGISIALEENSLESSADCIENGYDT